MNALMILFSIIFSTVSLSQNQETLKIKSRYGSNSKYNGKKVTIDTLNFKLKGGEVDINIGFQAGFHSPNLNKNRSDQFNRDILLEIYTGFQLSNEVEAIIAFNYWKAQTNTLAAQIHSETVSSKGLKLEIDFALFKIYTVSIILGPAIAFENISNTKNAVFSFGTNLKLKLPLWDSKVNLLSTVNYQTGSEVFELGGGGMGYSFFSYLFGIEVSLVN